MTGHADVRLCKLGGGWRLVKWMYQALFFSLSSQRSKEAKNNNNNNAWSQVNIQHTYLPSCITSIPIPLFTLVTQSSKSVEKNLAYFKIYWIFGTNTSRPSKAMQNGILSIILLHEKICNLVGLEQWYFSLIWKSYMWKLQTFCG